MLCGLVCVDWNEKEWEEGLFVSGEFPFVLFVCGN